MRKCWNGNVRNGKDLILNFFQKMSRTEELRVAMKKIDEKNQILQIFCSLFKELHPNEHFIYAYKPYSNICFFNEAYRPGYFFCCLQGSEVKTYFYYEDEMIHKLKVRNEKPNLKYYKDVEFDF